MHRTRHQASDDREEKNEEEEEEEKEGERGSAISGSSERPAAAVKHWTTRHQEKVAMEEVKEGRKKVMQLTFIILISIQCHPN